jgi:hypothetical protein
MGGLSLEEGGMCALPRGPSRLVRFCGADCSECDSYWRFLAGDASGLVNPDSGYRCCWLPRDYPHGRDCGFRICCEARGLRYCGECDDFERRERIAAFYAQPGYDKLRRRMASLIRSERLAGQDT